MLMGPPRRADLLLTLVAMSATLMAYATPGRFDGLTWVAVALWMLCVIVWVLRVEWRRYHGARQAHVTTRDEFRRSMAAMPALLLLTIALIWVGIPVRIGFLISRAGLENAVNMIGANALRRDQAVRAGLYRVRLLDDPQSPSVSFGVEGDVAMSEKRFVYVPDAEIAAGRKANWVRRRHLRLSTNWFVSAPP